MPAYFDDKILEQVRSSPRNSIEEVIAEHLRLDRKGKDYVGLCPFHSDNRPSMYVSPSKGIFKCFACGAGGDVFKFLQLREGLSFPQAVEMLAKRAGIVLDVRKENRPKPQSINGLPYAEPADVASVNQWAMQFWKDMYNGSEGQKARDYVKARGISEQMATDWNLGFAPESWDAFSKAAKGAGFNEELLVASGLLVRREDSGRVYDKFRNRLMFPILDTSSRVIAFGGRTLGDDPAKYMNSPATSLFDKSRSLYGLDKARFEIVNKAKAIVVEGYTDVMMCHQFGVKNVVAALGTSFTSGHALMIRRFAREIIIVLDSDVAGQAASDRALDICLNENLEVRLAMVSEGKDPCDFLLASGADAFSDIIENAKDAMSYKWDKFIARFDSDTTIPQKKEAIRDFIDTMATAINSGAVDGVSKGLLLKRLSSLTGIEVHQINRSLKKASGKNSHVTHNENQEITKIEIGDGYLERAQKEIIQSLINKPELFPTIETRIALDFFTIPVLRKIIENMLSIFESEEDFTASMLLGRVSNPAVSSFIVDMIETDDDDTKKIDYVRQLRQAISVLEENEKMNQLGTEQINSDEDLNKYLEKVRARHSSQSRSNLRSGIFAG
ncbi:MAG: DNA primase [Sedimentisphaeraceae bacterium JB056]